MISIAILGVLAAALGDREPEGLPICLGDDVEHRVEAADAPAVHEHVRDEWWLGPRFGVVSSYDSDDAVFLAGVQLRVRLLSWLWVEGTADVHTTESYHHGDIRVVQVPTGASALFFLPLEGDFRPYAAAGAGIDFSRVTYHGTLGSTEDKTSVTPIWLHIGFGAQYFLAERWMLDADLRFAFVDTPTGLHGNSFDFIQFSVGLNYRL
jgi:opacity protein-like surface antigen